jgi:hypothetical protein
VGAPACQPTSCAYCDRSGKFTKDSRLDEESSRLSEEPASKKVIPEVAEAIERGKLSHRGGKGGIVRAVERPDYSQWGLGQKIGPDPS